MDVCRRLTVGVGDGHQSSGSDQLCPRDERSHLLKGASEYLLGADIGESGHQDDRGGPRAALRIRWVVKIHGERTTGICGSIALVSPNRDGIDVWHRIHHPFLRDVRVLAHVRVSCAGPRQRGTVTEKNAP